MTNNDILIRVRYALNLPDPKVLELFELAGEPLDRPSLEAYFRREDEAGYLECPDRILASFLDGLIISRRGRKDGAATPLSARGRVGNNDVLKSLRIALELKDEDLVAIMALAGVKVSKSEVSALFRRPGHPNYRPCMDQFLRNFLQGLTAQKRV